MEIDIFLTSLALFQYYQNFDGGTQSSFYNIFAYFNIHTLLRYARLLGPLEHVGMSCRVIKKCPENLNHNQLTRKVIR